MTSEQRTPSERDSWKDSLLLDILLSVKNGPWMEKICRKQESSGKKMWNTRRDLASENLTQKMYSPKFKDMNTTYTIWYEIHIRNRGDTSHSQMDSQSYPHGRCCPRRHHRHRCQGRRHHLHLGRRNRRRCLIIIFRNSVLVKPERIQRKDLFFYAYLRV